MSDDEGEDETGVGNADDTESSRSEAEGGCMFGPDTAVNCLEDITKVNFK
jgi:hypothetical protein